MGTNISNKITQSLLPGLSHNKNENKVYFAGAMNPLYYVQYEQFIEIKADKMPIGGQSVYIERAYTTHVIDIATPTTIYLCSDGFQDQFGGEQNKKYPKPPGGGDELCDGVPNTVKD